MSSSAWSIQAQAPTTQNGRIVYPIPNGVDDYGNIQAALNAMGGGVGGTVQLYGTYVVSTPKTLLIPSGVTLDTGDSGTQLLRNWSGTSTYTGAFISTGDGTGLTKASECTIRGQGTIGVTSLSMLGNVITAYCDHFVTRDFRITGWSAGRAVFGAGNHWRGDNVTITGSTGNAGDGGWRYAGGSDSVFKGLHIVSGDDVLQAVPVGGTPGIPLYDQSITRLVYDSCTGQSLSARFMAVALNNSGSVFGGLTCAISHVRFIGCNGLGNSRSLMIFGRDSNGSQNGGVAMDDIQFIGCMIDCSQNKSVTLTGTVNTVNPQVNPIDTSNLVEGMSVLGVGIPGSTMILSVDSPQQITLNNQPTVNATEQLTFGGYTSAATVNGGLTYYAGAGSIRSLKFTDFSIYNPAGTKTTFNTTAGVIQDVELTDCYMQASPNLTGVGTVLDLEAVSSGHVKGGRYDGGGVANLSQVIRGGLSTWPSTDIVVDGAHLTGIGTGANGVQFTNCNGGRVTHTRMEPAAAATPAGVVSANNTSQNLAVTDNDFSQMTPVVYNDSSIGGMLIKNNLGDAASQAPLSQVDYITSRWYKKLGPAKASTTLAAGTVSKLMAVRLPVYLWGRTIIGLGVNQTQAPVIGAGTAASAFVRMAVAPDSGGGVPGSAIVTNSEVAIDAIAGGIAELNGSVNGGTGVIAPSNGWLLFALATPTAGNTLGTLGTYPTFDTMTMNDDAIGAGSPTATNLNAYQESGQTAFVALTGYVIPLTNIGIGTGPQISFEFK